MHDSSVTFLGITQAGPPLGMQYGGKAQLSAGARSRDAYCSGSSLVVPSDSKTQKLSLVLGATTNYDQKAGTSDSDYSFALPGSDKNDTNSLLGPIISKVTSSAATKSESRLRQAHVADYQALASRFILDLPDTAGSFGLETSVLIDKYSSSGESDPYLESTIF